jgi:epoxyqueuosine reductase
MRSKSDIRTYARCLEIDLIGFTDTQPLEENARTFQAWLDSGCAGDMDWMKSGHRQRFAPSALLQGAKTVISIGMSYFCEASPTNGISRYAWGKDYHLVLKEKLVVLSRYLKEADPQLRTCICVDAFPIAEKPIAQKAGLGWQGKHTLLINEACGSWIFLGELIIDREYPPDEPAQDKCGPCRACIDACPTGALLEDRTIDAGKCLSYLTIEYHGEKRHNLRGTVFGCDICQEACPWNTNPRPSRAEAFLRPNPLAQLPLERLLQLSKDNFLARRKNTVFERIGYERFKRNLT